MDGASAEGKTGQGEQAMPGTRMRGGPYVGQWPKGMQGRPCQRERVDNPGNGGCAAPNWLLMSVTERFREDIINGAIKAVTTATDRTPFCCPVMESGFVFPPPDAELRFDIMRSSDFNALNTQLIL
jgi:hypothetical protein